MSGLSYPFKFECSACEEETIVTRDQARYRYPDPESTNAPDVVLEQRGWVQGASDELYCPDCAIAGGSGR
jgi:hypothetical protein